MRLGLLPLVASVLFTCARPGTCGDTVRADARVTLDRRGARTAAELGGRPQIRVDSTLVLIPVTVTDPLGRLVTGLAKENFTLFEDNHPQEIVSLSNEDMPVSVGLVFDCSASMGEKLEQARDAVAQFLKEANPQDEFFLVEFNNVASLVQPFTTNSEVIQNRLLFARPEGRTALLDAVYLALQESKKARHARQALLILSDGGDNDSRYGEGEIKSLVKEADAQIYAIGIYEPIERRIRTPEEWAGPDLLTEITRQSGGRQYTIRNLDQLADVAKKIGVELRSQYVLGYTPRNHQHDGKYRRVQVKVNEPKGLPPMRAFWRMGYYAPLE